MIRGPDDDDPARRQGRDHRSQRLGQDDPDPTLCSASCRRDGDDPARYAAGSCLLRPVESHARRGEDGPAKHQRLRHRFRSNGQPRHILGYLQDFLFTPERSRSLVKFLSGGERSRLLLAKLFTKPSNLLVLDEPTNDLDIETLELLESLLVEYQGTVLLVSHDRAFLNDVVTSTLAIETDGRVKEYDGGYDDYLRQREAGEARRNESVQPPVKQAGGLTGGQKTQEAQLQGAAGAGIAAGADRGARVGDANAARAMADPRSTSATGSAIARTRRTTRRAGARAGAGV